MYKQNLSSTIILVISFLYAFLVGVGLYGYGMDYYGAYTKGFEWNIDRVNILNYFGFRVSTLEIFGVYIGVYIITFMLTISTGFLIRNHMKLKQSYSPALFFLIFITVIHTWPIIMSTSNAMRQGLAMSFIFLALANCHRNFYIMIFFSFIAFFAHKSGIFFLTIFIFVSILHKLFKYFFFKNQAWNNFLVGTSICITMFYFIEIIIPESLKSSRIIGGDYSLAFVFIGFIYVGLSFFFKAILTNKFNLIVYYYSFFSLPLIIYGLNWQYERLSMMMIIPYILSYGAIFNKASYKFYLILSFFTLLILTIYTGMYSRGLYYKDDPFLYGIANF